MRTIYLHVGPYKTGSSSIQKTFFKHRKLLIEKFNLLYLGYHYDHGPSFRNLFHSEPEKLHNNELRGLSKESIEIENKRLKKAISDDIKNHPDSDIIISGEHISDLSYNELLNLKTFLSTYSKDIRIAYLFRDPYNLIKSDLQEAIKNGRATISDWDFDYIIRRYEETPNDFISVFGEAACKFYNFESLISSNVGFVKEFAKEFISINLPESINEITANRSSSNASFYFMNCLNKVQPSVVNGQKNKKRSMVLQKSIRNLKGNKINFQAQLSNDFTQRLNKAVKHACFLSNANYDKVEVSSYDGKIEFEEYELVNFISDLNTQLIEIENEKKSKADDIRDVAISYESTDLELAYKLMKIAKDLKPDGPFISKKLDEYHIKIKKIQS
ncbi:hypothetical protein [Zobellella taiwanensis]